MSDLSLYETRMTLPTQTQAVQVVGRGGVNQLRDVTLKLVPPGPGQLLIEVVAAGINFADIMMRSGLYPEAPPLPFVPGYEIAGVVRAVGSPSSIYRLGDRVFGGTYFGGYAAWVCLDERQVRATPSYLSHEEAAGLTVNYLTAWIALTHYARVKRGERVLIQSAAGGVGLAAVQICHYLQTPSIGVVGSPAKIAVVRSQGCPLVWTRAEYAAQGDSKSALDLPIAVVLDSTGGASLRKSLNSLSPGGRVIAFGTSSLVAGEQRSLWAITRFLLRGLWVNPLSLMMQNRGIHGLNLLPLFRETGPECLLQQSLDEILKHVHARRFKPLIGRCFEMNAQGAQRAHRFLQSRESIGKLVLVREVSAG